MPIQSVLRKPAKTAKLKNNKVMVLIYDGLCTFEYACATEVFAMPRPEVGLPWYRFQTCAQSSGWLQSQYGLKVKADTGLESLEQAGIIIIPGWKAISAPVPQPIVDALLCAYKNGARLVSICSGVVVIAATGLLNGKRATTHWRYADELQKLHPKITVDPTVLYVDEGRLLTSAGSAAGLDLCLHLVRRDFGPKIANQVARRLVVPPHRDGGQAHELLETSKQSVELIATNVGLGTASTLRHHFRKRLGTSPAAYRSRFSHKLQTKVLTVPSSV
jgi:AraC family transcriptional regulator, transcriptional activator FtrA